MLKSVLVVERNINTWGVTRYKSCLSQNEHLLVPKCVLPLEAYEDSSFQHVLVDDCTAKLQAEGTLPEETINMRVVELPVSATEDRVVRCV